MPLLFDTKLVRIPLTEPGEWVEVKERLSKGDMVKIESLTLQMKITMNTSVPGEAQQADATLELAEDLYDAMMFKGLELGIVNWSFDVPVTAENIRRLDPDDFAIIKTTVDRLWKSKRGADDLGNSSKLASLPSNRELRSQRS